MEIFICLKTGAAKNFKFSKNEISFENIAYNIFRKYIGDGLNHTESIFKIIV